MLKKIVTNIWPYLFVTVLIFFLTALLRTSFADLSGLRVTPYVLLGPVFLVLALLFGKWVGLFASLLGTSIMEFVFSDVPNLGRMAVLSSFAVLVGYLAEQLRRNRNEALKANRAKSNFLAMVNHDLRTPLNAILGFSDLLLSSTNLTDQQVDNLKKISKAGKHLLYLVNDLLNFSAIERDRVELQRDYVDLKTLVKEQLAMFLVLTEDKNIRIFCDIKINRRVFVDKNRIIDVINNLIANAIKYTPVAGEIRIWGYDNSDGTVTLVIEDNGFGIAEKDLKRIFIPFEQITPEINGVGLGLAICNRLVGAHGGKLSVESKLGAGSKFYITLP